MKLSSRVFKASPLLLIMVMIGVFIFSAQPAKAIPVEDLPAAAWNVAKNLWQKSGSQIFNQVLTRTVNKLAYEYATYLGSGAQGQKPQFLRKNIWDYTVDAGDAAFGQVLEVISQSTIETGVIESEWVIDPNCPPDQRCEYVKTKPQVIKDKGLGINLCAPDLDILKKIALGIGSVQQPPDVDAGLCTFSTFRKNWQDEWARYKYIGKDGNIFKELSKSFDPGVSDLAVSMDLMGITFDVKTKAMGKASQTAMANGGWLRVQNLIGGTYKDAPGSAAREDTMQRELQTLKIGKYTGDVLVDAANIFINQLALSAFNKLMRGIGSSDSGGSNNFAYSPDAQGGTSGVRETEQASSQLLQANFSQAADYEILSKLTSCPSEKENTPGPTDCVITETFAQAIEAQMTIAQALDKKLLDPNKRLGFDERGESLNYKNGYPYRSLIILRKYRILPVGWEVAAQYIKKNPQATKDVTLAKLLACFSKTDTIYTGYNDLNSDPSESWCENLVDPNWVLKLPQLYCGMKGYGPDFMFTNVAPSSKGYCAKTDKDCSDKISADCESNWESCSKDDDCVHTPLTGYEKCNYSVARQVTVKRNDYCADEQSCIKESSTGACSNYGYCTEEQRRWKFTDKENSCEARNNTCQTFQAETGGAVSYLENTLDYANCGPNQVGCRKYATESTQYNPGTNGGPDKITWKELGSHLYFNKRTTDCDSSKEGCHQFIRTKDDLGTNLIADANFESLPCITTSGGETLLPSNKFNPFVKSALAQAALGNCALTTITSPGGFLPSPLNRWYIRTSSSVEAGITNEESFSTSQSLYIHGEGGLYSDNSTPSTPSILPAGFQFEDERFYTLSANIYVIDGSVKVGFGTSVSGQSIETTSTGVWQPVTVIFYRPAGGAKDFYIEGTSAATEFYVDNIKLTVGESLTSYSGYLDNNVIYQKLLPSYLEASCYVTPGSDYKLKNDAPAQCKSYVRKCNSDEVGCETYTSTATRSISITGKVRPKDVCPASCLGYDVFVEQPTFVSIEDPVYFIPSSARSCSSQSVGCTAFTNLDKLEQGGEAKEYYSYLRTCIKPDVNSCDEFYTWEGSDDSGYQLRVFSLKKGINSEPESTMDPGQESLVCNEDVFNKLPSDPGYNYDCREFYNRTGDVSYHLYSRTISCSDDCHPYRREVASAQICTDGGGTWDSSQSRCLYYSVPGEGTICSAAEVGCREYTGNIASDIRVINNKVDGFEEPAPNDTNGWLGGSISNTSLELGGKSLTGSDLSKFIGDYDIENAHLGVRRDTSYVISFLAKKAQAVNVTISGIELVNEANESAGFSISSSAIIGSEWRIYTFNLDKLDHEVTPISGEGSTMIGEKLRITFSNAVYIDNIKLVEVPNRYFLIKDSWTTPDECDQTVTGAYWPQYMLGCSQYKDRANKAVNLHGFSQLCQESAAGCEQMIDTQNSNNYKQAAYNDDNYNGTTEPTDNNGVCDSGETSCVSVGGDKMINVVYDTKKLCAPETKGCQRLGLASTYDGAITYSDIYKINDPNKYEQIVCKANEVGCSSWSNGTGGTVFFKDPGDMTCEWRKKAQANEYNWFKKKVKRCSGLSSGALCSNNSDCPNPQTCTLDNSDIYCELANYKTVGSGGSGNYTTQPASWAGVCDAAQAGCSEYIDPLSKFNDNLITNPSYKDLDGNPSEIEHWIDATLVINGNPIDGAKQPITLDPQTIYILKGAGPKNASLARVKISCPGVNTGDKFRVLGSDNNFSERSSYDTDLIAGAEDESLEFYFQSSSPDKVVCTVFRDNRLENQTVYLRKAIVEYQKEQNLDRTSANGLVNIDAGFVLFNERGQEGANKKPLTFNADKTFDTGVEGRSPQAGAPLNANVILKVKPDRSCAKWLACVNYIPDPTDTSKKICLEIGLCDKLNPDGNCAHYASDVVKKNQGSLDSGISNLSGYSKVGYVNSGGSLVLADYYNLASMTQIGQKIDITNGGFEESGKWDTLNGAKISNQPSLISALNLNPLNPTGNNNGQDSGSSYLAPEGKGLLELEPSAFTSHEDSILLGINQRYVITFYSYSKGNGLSLVLDSVNATTPDINIMPALGDNEPKNQWIKHSFGFKSSAADPEYKIKFTTTAQGAAYIDDVRIDPAINYRCSSSNASGTCDNPAVSGHCSVSNAPCNYDFSCPKTETCITDSPIPNYIGSSCRLYARDNSLACAYNDSETISHKGIYGYCLESDPVVPSTCLLWYPVSRIASDQAAEGSFPTFGNDNVYYCLEAADQCNGTTPQLYCKTLLEVDKDIPWNTRLKAGSSFEASDNTPFFAGSNIFHPTMTVSLGVKNNGGQAVGIPKFTMSTASGAYGAVKRSDINTKVSDTTGKIGAFVPLWFPKYFYDSGVPGTRKESHINRTTCMNDSEGGYFLDIGVNDVAANNIDSAYVLNLNREVTDHCTNCNNMYCWKGCPDNDWNDDANDGGNRVCSGGTDHCFDGTAGLTNGYGKYSSVTGWDQYDDRNSHAGLAWVTQGADDAFPSLHKINNGEEIRATFTGAFNIKQFYVIKGADSTAGTTNAKEFIKRLFPAVTSCVGGSCNNEWKQYTWNGSSYGAGTILTNTAVMSECANGVRPTTYSVAGLDYCYIKPKIYGFSINGVDNEDYVVNGSETVPLTFSTQTDKDQLPITEIKIDWGFFINNSGGRAQTILGPRLIDTNPRSNSRLLDYYQIKNLGSANSSVCPSLASYCDIIPTIKITDNWGYYHEFVSPHKIRIKKPTN